MSPEDIADRLESINTRSDLARAATCSLLAEGVAITLFLCGLSVWLLILGGK